ncbi:MAG TPA: 3-deoxy-D-manno-octulosonic acid transferase [Terriglobales bacterium]|nr:3-deoxy-D-manno-octulosonic acid transferase [Terriglobales bacterium]
MSFPMYWLYSALLALGLLVTLPYWLLQMLRHGKYRSGLAERLGRVPERLGVPQNGNKPTIWIHAVSVGEVLAVSRLITELRTRFPKYRVLVSTTTDTGQKLARERFGESDVFYFPLDLGFAIQPYLDGLRPRLVVVAETELWPNFFRLAKHSGARIAVVNARISDRSFSGYRRFRCWLANVLKHIDLFLAQTQADYRRLLEIGAPPERAQVSGNLKFDVASPTLPAIIASLRTAFRGTDAGPIIVAGSTMEGEEPLLLRAFEIVRGGHRKAVMILAPRHLQRFEHVAELLASLNIPFWRRSLWSGEDLSGSVLLLDTIGELAAVYGLGQLAFVGGSLVEHGGHNVLEPAQYGVPVVIGPHYQNFRDIVDLFRAADAIRVVGAAELPLCFVELLSNEAERERIGRRALETARSQTGATERTVKALEMLLTTSEAPVDSATQ